MSIEEWPGFDNRGITCGGSLYAAPAESREAFARILVQRNAHVHIDLIIRGQSLWQGVDETTLNRITQWVPQELLDVHVIALEATSAETVPIEQAAIQIARNLSPAWITLSPETIQRFPETITALQSQNIGIWSEVRPSATISEQPQHIDGVMIMLIEPGTSQAADLEHLNKIPDALAAGYAVGIDGGVNAESAAQAAKDGAHYFVSGRALLSLLAHEITQQQQGVKR